MKLRKNHLIAAVGVALLATVAWKIIGTGAGDGARKAVAPIVRVSPAVRQTVVYPLKFTGDIQAIQQANIFSKVNGTLERVFVNMGSEAANGQLLALIDTTELSHQMQESEATYANTDLTFERAKTLSERNLISKQELDNAEAAMKVAKANYEVARTRRDYAFITAPFRGIVTKRFLDPGASISANNISIFTLMDLDAVKVIVNVLERDISIVTVGTEAVITVDAFPGAQFRGRVARLSQAVDLSTRTMAVEIDIPNPGHRLKPGMFASVALAIREHKDAIVVPTQAILSDERGSYVFALNGTTARRIPVTTGYEQSGKMEILAGLDGSERIVVTGQQFARDGMEVTIQP